MTSRAFADSAHEQADALFRQGKELMGQQKLAEACAAFEGSNRLEPNTSTLLNHANCREKNGQLATAWRLFIDAEQQTHGRIDPASKQLNAVAADRATKLEVRLSKLSIDVPSDRRLDGIEILRGDDRVAIEAWSRPVPVDGGTYEIMVRAPGRIAWSTTVTLRPEGDVQTVTVPKLAFINGFEPRPRQRATDGVSRSATQARKHLSGPNPAQSATLPQDSAVKRSLAVPLAMGGAALLLSGAAFALSRWGDSIYADAEREPNDVKQEALWRSANQRRYAAIGFAAGAAGYVGAALYLYLRGGREAAQPASSRSLRLAPTATASSLGIGMSGAW
jgi:hypothetical protein